VIRAVIDTNVYVAALLSRDGAPARVVRALADGLFDAIVCPQLLAELEGVLARPRIARDVPPDVAHGYLEWLTRVAILEPDPVDVARRSPDPDDDYLLALTASSRSQVLVSGDAHLLNLGSTEPRVVTPAAFAAVVEGLR
jgi:putative PIN family toxin of toxin-antitoxin system